MRCDGCITCVVCNFLYVVKLNGTFYTEHDCQNSYCIGKISVMREIIPRFNVHRCRENKVEKTFMLTARASWFG